MAEPQKYSAFGIIDQQPFDLNPTGNESIVYDPASRPTQAGTLLPGQSIADLTFVSGYSQRRIRITMNPQDNPVQNAGSIAIIDENGNFIFVAGFSSSAFGVPVVIIAPPLDTIGLQIIGVDNTTADLIDLQLPDPSDADAIHITQSGSGDGIDIDMLPTSTGDGINITQLGSGRGIEIDIDNSSSGVNVIQSGIGNGFNANVDIGRGVNSVANGGFAFAAEDSDPAGGIFQRILLFNNGTGPFVILSDGTDPDTVVIAPIGSVCFNASPTGQLSYNTDGATAWTLL